MKGISSDKVIKKKGILSERYHNNEHELEGSKIQIIIIILAVVEKTEHALMGNQADISKTLIIYRILFFWFIQYKEGSITITTITVIITTTTSINTIDFSQIWVISNKEQ